MNSKSSQDREHFNALIVQLEHDLGARDACVLFLECMKNAVAMTAFKDKDALRHQLMDFYEIFINLKPRIAIIQNYLDRAIDVLADHPEADVPHLLKQIEKRLEEAEKDSAALNRRLITEGVKLIHDNSTILIHSNSHSVLDVLIRARRSGKKFKVVVAEQEANLTLEMIKILQDNDIHFVVVPEYMLANIEEDISFMLIGSLTLKNDMQFVVHAGTRALVAEMNDIKTPVYLLMTTNKFSYWKASAAQQTIKTVKSMYHKDGDFYYERIKFSHGRLPVEQVTKVVTEDGALTIPEVKDLYARKLADYQKQSREISTIQD